jgi:hypothetical protein
VLDGMYQLARGDGVNLDDLRVRLGKMTDGYPSLEAQRFAERDRSFICQRCGTLFEPF